MIETSNVEEITVKTLWVLEMDMLREFDNGEEGGDDVLLETWN